MALVFFDSFDYYATAQLPLKYSAVGVNAEIKAGLGRRGTASLELAASSLEWVQYNHTSATYIIGFAVKKTTTGSSGNYVLCRIVDGSTTQCSLRLSEAGVLDVVRGSSTAVTGGVAASAFPSQTDFHYVEWKVTISDSISANTCIVRVDGAEFINVAAGQSLRATANNQGTNIIFGSESVTGTVRQFDDLYICDGSGSKNNNFLGDIRVDVILPNGAGTYTDGTPSTGSDNWAMVDETLLSTTDYVSFAYSASPNLKDSYAFADLPALGGSLVLGVQVNAAAATSDSGATRDVAIFTKSASTEDTGASKTVATALNSVRELMEDDPDTSTAWTQSGVNAAEFGVKVTG